MHFQKVDSVDLQRKREQSTYLNVLLLTLKLALNSQEHLGVWFRLKQRLICYLKRKVVEVPCDAPENSSACYFDCFGESVYVGVPDINEMTKGNINRTSFPSSSCQRMSISATSVRSALEGCFAVV